MRQETLPFKKYVSPSFFSVSSVFLILLLACNQHASYEVNPAVMAQSDSMEKKFTAAMVDNKKDPNCGMPVTAGIKDTVHYDGKVYGFCSDECKQAFLKNPAALAKNAVLK